jgi:hypothetical protein
MLPSSDGQSSGPGAADPVLGPGPIRGTTTGHGDRCAGTQRRCPQADRSAGRDVDSRQSIWKPDYSVFRCGQDQPGIGQRPLANACGQQAPIPSDTVWHAANRYGTPSSPFDRQVVIGRPSPLRPQPKYHCRMADAPHRSRNALPIGPDRTVEFDSAYEGTPPGTSDTRNQRF